MQEVPERYTTEGVVQVLPKCKTCPWYDSEVGCREDLSADELVAAMKAQKLTLDDVTRAVPFESVKRVVGNWIRPEPRKKPLVAVYYLDYACNAHCGFCSQSENVYGDQRKDVPRHDLDTARHVLRLIRASTPNIYLTGGEPTIVSGFVPILEECTTLGFETVGVNTNAIHYVPEILDHADRLVVSMHSWRPDRISDIMGISEETAEQIIRNIYRYACAIDPRKTEMVLNCVATGDNMTDVAKVIHFANKLGVHLNVAPAVMPDGTPAPGLVNNVNYQRLLDLICELPGIRVASAHYYQTIREFRPFPCTPHVMPAIQPNGDVIVPCSYVKTPVHVNMIEAGGLNEALKVGRQKFGTFNPARDCPELCHKMCFVEGSAVSRFSGWTDMLKSGADNLVRRIQMQRDVDAQRAMSCWM